MSATLTVSEFMAVRREVANALKAGGSKSEERVRVSQAEFLMQKGLIDIQAALASSPLIDLTRDDEEDEE